MNQVISIIPEDFEEASFTLQSVRLFMFILQISVLYVEKINLSQEFSIQSWAASKTQWRTICKTWVLRSMSRDGEAPDPFRELSPWRHCACAAHPSFYLLTNVTSAFLLAKWRQEMCFSGIVLTLWGFGWTPYDAVNPVSTWKVTFNGHELNASGGLPRCSSRLAELACSQTKSAGRISFR